VQAEIPNFIKLPEEVGLYKRKKEKQAVFNKTKTGKVLYRKKIGK
jgi:hypothetical protein